METELVTEAYWFLELFLELYVLSQKTDEVQTKYYYNNSNNNNNNTSSPLNYRTIGLRKSPRYPMDRWLGGPQNRPVLSNGYRGGGAISPG
jgi:hypothetical protein